MTSEPLFMRNRVERMCTIGATKRNRDVDIPTMPAERISLLKCRSDSELDK